MWYGISILNWMIVTFPNPNVKSNVKCYDVTFGEKQLKINVSRTNIAMAIYDFIKKRNSIKKCISFLTNNIYKYNFRLISMIKPT